MSLSGDIPSEERVNLERTVLKEVAFHWWNKGKLVGLECGAKGGMGCVEFGGIWSSMDTCNS